MSSHDDDDDDGRPPAPAPSATPDHSNVILLPNLRPPPAPLPPPQRPLFAEGDEDEDETLSPEDLLAPPLRRPVATPRDGGLGESEPLEESGPPPDHLIEPAVEALLLAADGPMSDEDLDAWLDSPGKRRVREALHRLQTRLLQEQRGIRLVEVARGWQLRTDVRFARWVAAMRGGKPTRLSKAALETLAVIAYRQPVTRTEIEELRGVDSGGVLRMLCERDLTTIVGRREEPGRPLIYGTTPQFLSLFNLRNLSDLPTLRDLRALQQDSPEGAGAGITPPPRDPRRPPDLRPLESLFREPAAAAASPTVTDQADPTGDEDGDGG